MIVDYEPKTQVAFCVLTVGDKYLLMKRDDIPSIPEPGMWALFGGRMEDGETPYEAVVREVLEETELDASGAVLLGSMKVTNDPLEAVFHIFHLDVTDQMSKFKLHEGQAWGQYREHEINYALNIHPRTKDFIYMHQFREIDKTKVVAMCHGVFDVLHHDHIRLFNLAKMYADYVIVSMVADRFVDKGPGRPIVDEHSRAFTLASLRAVDKVIITRSLFPFDNIKCFRPDFYVHGKIEDHLPEDELLAELGVKVVVREGGHKKEYRATSSSTIIEGLHK
jgi:cytidyltransferase-like protein